jgi:hypothetical protein
LAAQSKQSVEMAGEKALAKAAPLPRPVFSRLVSSISQLSPMVHGPMGRWSARCRRRRRVLVYQLTCHGVPGLCRLCRRCLRRSRHMASSRSHVAGAHDHHQTADDLGFLAVRRSCTSSSRHIIVLAFFGVATASGRPRQSFVLRWCRARIRPTPSRSTDHVQFPTAVGRRWPA